jgi:NAD(P)-dependent dehydrogenase (short-subunit alcohol dehydrogenase family)
MTVPCRTGTIAVAGAASGIGAATARPRIADGHRGIAVDLFDADVSCERGTEEHADNTQRSGGEP